MPSNGAAELARIGARLQAEGDGLLRARTLKSMRAAAQPLKPKVRNAALAKLPKSGGLNEVIASHPIRVTTSTAGRNAGVRLRTQGTRTDGGTVRHPVFPHGERETWNWVEEAIPGAGWWSDTLRESAPAVTAVLLKMMAETAAQVEG